jgi:thiamine biosynthesis lipoprotein
MTSSCAIVDAPRAVGVQRRARALLGTYVEIACAGEPARCLAAIDAAFGAIQRVHALMSVHEATSDLARMNAHAHERPVRVDAETLHVLEAALELHRESQGAFDVAAGSGGTSGDIRVLAGSRVRFARPMRVDFGGIAKGHAVDRATDELAAHGIGHAVVNAGGDLRVLGDVAELVHVRDPGEPTRALPALRLARGALATSAGYFTRAIVDPRTGTAPADAQSVSVVAPTAMRADALAKVVLLRGAGSSALLARHDAHALVLSLRNGALHARWLPRIPG